ncbi:hypothetical protein Trco_001852 [Trichoderma cornu-damae]|uniref:Uncharacterized protein n=1 Tax=Trichoderma cornu-damae TaxID=654480 RepID=A0A9P8QNR8_9HYPO|nr:hypothetical protein Trco_001852 [Trichoderma cornu-damae]
MTSTLHLRHIPSTGLIRITPISTFRRSIHQTVPRPQPAAKADEDENLEQSEGKEHKGAPQPRISNLSMPGVNTSLGLTEEEKEEVRRQ